MPGPLTIAAVAAPFGGTLREDLDRVEAILDRAQAAGAELVVLPECAVGGFLRDTAEGEGPPLLPPSLEPDGPEIHRLARMAGARGLVVCAGYTEAGRPGGPWSAAVCVSGEGVHGHHRKVHLPPAERFAYSAGDSFAAFDTPVGRIGMLLCYDKLFPEAARALVLDGAEVIVSMAAWPIDRHHPDPTFAEDRQTRHFDVIDLARAVENQVTWVSSNQTGPWGRLEFLGRAKIVDPDGVVLDATPPGDEGMAIATLDVVERNLGIRAHIDHLADRRTAAYAGAAGVSHIRAAQGG